MSAEKSLPEHSGFGQRHLDDLAQIIAKYGQAVQSVGVPGTKCSCCDEPVEDDGEPPFTYTVGNHERGMPELLIVGFWHPVLLQVLNLMGQMQRDRGKGFEVGELVDYGADVPARIGPASYDVRDEYTRLVSVYYDTEAYNVVQVLLADPGGRYPDDPNCEGIAKLQKVLAPPRSSLN